MLRQVQSSCECLHFTRKKREKSQCQFSVGQGRPAFFGLHFNRLCMKLLKTGSIYVGTRKIVRAALLSIGRAVFLKEGRKSLYYDIFLQ